MRRLLALALSLLPTTAHAGLYSAAEPVPFAVAAGVAQPLPYEPQFKDLLDRNLSAGDASRPAQIGGKPTPRGELLARIETAKGLELAAALVRGNFSERALNLLAPRLRDRVPDFVALLTLAQAHAARGEWPEAARVHSAAFFDAEPPRRLPGATAEQTPWLLRVEKVYVKRWLDWHRRNAGLKREDTLSRGPPELFAGVTFAELGGSDAERAKLPPDAIPIAQQLLLWSPGDTDLLWLLGELYAARGELRAAEKVFDQCTWGRSYTDRPVLMAHRQRARDLVAALPPEAVDVVPDSPVTEAAPVEEKPARTEAELLRDYWPVPAGLLAVALLMTALQVRSWRRRTRR